MGLDKNHWYLPALFTISFVHAPIILFYYKYQITLFFLKKTQNIQAVTFCELALFCCLYLFGDFVL